MRIATFSDWYKLLAAPLLVTGATLAISIGVFSPSAGMLTFILVSFLVLMNANLPTAVLLIAALVPFDFHRQIGDSWIYIDLAVLPLAFLLLENRPPLRSFVLFPFVVWIMIADSLRATEPHVFFTTWIHWLEGAILCCAVAATFVGAEVLIVLGYTLIPLSLYAVYQVAIGDFGDLYRALNPRWAFEVAWLPGRAYSLMFGANTFGGFAALILVVLIALAVNKIRTNTCVVLSGFAFVGLVCSGSRGGAIGAAAGILIILACKRRLLWALGFTAVLVVLVWTISYFVTLPIERMAQSDDFTVETRLLGFYASTRAFFSHPLVGIGSTNFINALHQYVNWPIGDIRSPHNTYLHLLAENGLVGALLFFAPIVYCLVRSWKHRQQPVMLACLAAIVCSCVHGLVDFLWMAPQYGLTMAILLGICLMNVVPTPDSRW
jgi:O-antigen ligase